MVADGVRRSAARRGRRLAGGRRLAAPSRRHAHAADPPALERPVLPHQRGQRHRARRRRPRPNDGDRRRPSRRAAHGGAGRGRRGRRHRRPRPAASHAPRLAPAAGAGVAPGHRYRDSGGARCAAATQLAPAGRAGLPAVRHRGAVDHAGGHGSGAAGGGPGRRLPRGLPAERAAHPGRDRHPRCRTGRCARALRTASVARRRGGARLPRGGVLDPDLRRDAGVRPSASPRLASRAG